MGGASASSAAPTCARAGCSNPAPKRGKYGPPRRYCSNACRTAAYRHRTSPDADTTVHLIHTLNEARRALISERQHLGVGDLLCMQALKTAERAIADTVAEARRRAST